MTRAIIALLVVMGRAALLAAILIQVAPTLAAWDLFGHHVVAAVAWEELARARGSAHARARDGFLVVEGRSRLPLGIESDRRLLKRSWSEVATRVGIEPSEDATYEFLFSDAKKGGEEAGLVDFLAGF